MSATIQTFCWIQKLTWEPGSGPNLGWELGFGTPLLDPRLEVSAGKYSGGLFRGVERGGGHL